MEEFMGSEELEFGGYVEPPTHLTKKATKVGDFPAELRTVPDYDYSLFRYSKLALPFLVLIMLTAAVLAGLTFWQGPWGFNRGPNGIQDGVPRDIAIEDIGVQELDHEAGIPNAHFYLRIVVFCIALFGVLLAIFGIRMNPKPGLLKVFLGLAGLLFIVAGIIAIIVGAIGIDKINDVFDCPDFTYPRLIQQPNLVSGSNAANYINNHLRDVTMDCENRDEIALAQVVVDFLLGIFCILAAVAIFFTMGKKTWAWGPGRIPVQKSVLKPTIAYPPASPFMHIHETRRTMVWVLIFVVFALIILDFIFALVLHEFRMRAREIDENGLRTEQPGWPVLNNRFRIAVSFAAFGLSALMIVDLLASKRRLIAFVLAVLLFFTAIGAIIIFGLDVHDINDADELPLPVSPTINGVLVRLSEKQWAFGATAAIEFMLFIFILVFIIYEFLFRCLATLDTYYFYADSEWLRLNSLFVDHTDREAYDWKKFAMETGRYYFYSPTLGISTRTRPKNYVDPDFPTTMPLGAGLGGGPIDPASMMMGAAPLVVG